MVGSVRFIDFHGLGFNPLQVLDRRSPMAHLDVAGAMRDNFTDDASGVSFQLADRQPRKLEAYATP